MASNMKAVKLRIKSVQSTMQITSRKDNKEPGTSSLSAGQRFPYPA